MIHAVAAIADGRWREVLTMRYVGGSGLAEIAAVMEISVRAVEGLLHRARKELQSVLPVAARPACGAYATGHKEIAR